MSKKKKKKGKKEKPPSEIRTTTLGLYFPDENDYGEFLSRYKLYNQVCSKLAAELVLLAQAGADIKATTKGIRVEATMERREAVLASIFGKEGVSYPRQLLPRAKQLLDGRLNDYYAEAAIKEVKVWWSSKDALYNASKGWLSLQGDRRWPNFRNVKLPLRMDKDHPYPVDKTGHRITLRISRDFQPTAKIKTTETKYWKEWRAALDKTTRMGNPIHLIKNRKGRILLKAGYTRLPQDDLSEDQKATKTQRRAGRTTEAAFTGDVDNFIKLQIRTGHRSLIDVKMRRKLSAASALVQMDRYAHQQERAKQRVKSVPYGGRVAHREHDIQGKLTRARQKCARLWNSTWAKLIAVTADARDCEKVMLFDVPDTLFARSWQWADFKAQLEYKLHDRGIKLEVVESPKMGEAAAD